MNSGIVLKINRSSVFVLTPNGEYLKCKKTLSSYEIGQEIQFPNHAVIVNKNIKIFMPKLLPAMIACVLVLITFFGLNWNKQGVLAAGIVNVNSQVKVSLVLNKQLKVIDIKAQNAQGKKIVEKLDKWEQESLDVVMDDLIVKIEKSKAVHPDEKITVTGDMGKKYEDKQKKLNQKLNSIQRNNSRISLQNEQSKQNEHTAQKDLSKGNTIKPNVRPNVFNNKTPNVNNEKNYGSKQKDENHQYYQFGHQRNNEHRDKKHDQNGHKQGNNECKRNNKDESNDSNQIKNNSSNYNSNSDKKEQHHENNGNSKNKVNNVHNGRGNNHSDWNKKNELNQFIKKEEKYQPKFNASQEYKNNNKKDNRHQNKEKEKDKQKRDDHSNKFNHKNGYYEDDDR